MAEEEAAHGSLSTRHGWYTLDGAPVCLLDVSLPPFPREGDPLAGWRAALDSLVPLQTERVRFRLLVNPWAFCSDGAALSPWRADARDPGAFDDRYWSALAEAARAARDAGALVQVALFDGAALRPGAQGGWAAHPFNAANGGPLAERDVAAFYGVPRPADLRLFTQAPGADCDAGTRAQHAQQRFVRLALDALDGPPNVTWQVARDMGGADPVRVGFVSHYIQFLRAHDPIDRLVSFGTRAARPEAVFYRLTGVDALDLEWDAAEAEPHDELAEVVAALGAYGKPVSVQPAPGAESADRAMRWGLWQALVAGGYGGVRMGAERVTESLAGWLRTFAAFVEQVDLDDLAPGAETVRRAPDGVSVHGAGSAAQAVVYLTTRAPQPAGEVSLVLRRGAWQAQWTDPATGQPARAPQTVAAEAGTAAIAMPAFAEDLALLLRRG